MALTVDQASAGTEIRHQKRWRWCWPLIMLDHHEAGCTCSYCRKMRGPFGIAFAKARVWNAWDVVYWTWGGRRHYFRTTGFGLVYR